MLTYLIPTRLTLLLILVIGITTWQLWPREQLILPKEDEEERLHQGELSPFVGDTPPATTDPGPPPVARLGAPPGTHPLVVGGVSWVVEEKDIEINDAPEWLKKDPGGARYLVNVILAQQRAPNPSAEGPPKAPGVPTSLPGLPLVGSARVAEIPGIAEVKDERFTIAGTFHPRWVLVGARTKTRDLTVPPGDRTAGAVRFTYRFEKAGIPEPKYAEDALLRLVYTQLRAYTVEGPPGAPTKFHAEQALVALLNGPAMTGAFQQQHYYDVFRTFTLLHATRNVSDAAFAKGAPKEQLRTLLAKKLFANTAPRIEELPAKLKALGDRLATANLNPNLIYHSTYAYCNVVLIVNQLALLCGTYWEAVNPELTVGNAAEAARAKKVAGDLRDLQKHLLLKLMEAQRREGGWRFLWGTPPGWGEQDTSVSILCEFALSDSYRLYFWDKRDREAERLPRGWGFPPGEPLEAQLKDRIAKARGYIRARTRIAAVDVRALQSLQTVDYEPAHGRRYLVGGFYSTYAGSFIEHGEGEETKWVDTAREALLSGIPFGIFEEDIQPAKAEMHTYYNQMFFGRALSRTWSVYRGDPARETQVRKLERRLRALIEKNLDLLPAPPGPNDAGRQMSEYFLSLTFPIVEDLVELEQAKKAKGKVP